MQSDETIETAITPPELLSRLQLLESILHNASDAILVTEAEPVDLPGPRVVYVNESFTRMTGYTPADVIGKTPRILQSSRTDRAQLDKIRVALERWEPVQVELINQRKDGEEFWVEIHIVPIADETGWWTHWVSVQRDISARKQAEEQTRLNAERFRDALAQHATDLAAIVGRDGTVRYGIPSGARILGTGTDQWIGDSLFDHLHPDDARDARDAFAQVIETLGVGMPPIPFRARHRDGSWRHLMGAYTNRLNDPSVAGIVFNAWDVTAERRANEALHLRDQAIAASSNGIFIADATQPDMPVVYMNAAIERITGYAADELLGRNPRFLQGPEHDQPGVDALRAALTGEREWAGSLRNYRKDGTLFYNEMYISPVHDDAGRLRSFIGVLNDVTERRSLEDQLAHQAFHDALTALPNRALFMDRLEQSLARGRRLHHTVAVLFLDLDRFKVVNDSWGHDSGDELLVLVGQRLRDCLRPGDTIARLGGDEFTMLLDGPVSVHEAVAVAERAIAALQTHFVVRGREVFTTPSIGLAFSDGPDTDPTSLLRDADLAMYRAKERGRSRYEVFDPRMNAAAARRLELETQLHSVVERGELVLYYQPSVHLATGAIVGTEALLRWQHPEHGLIMPDEFIPLAEETGLILPIGRWVLEEACRQMHRWHTTHAAPSPLTMSVNLSAKQLQHPAFVEEVRQVLEHTGANPGCLILEITERMVMGDVQTTVPVLHQLKALGVQLAIDDFGTGYSSLSYLRRFPVDILKVDKSFVDGLGAANEDTALMRAVLGLGSALNLQSVAEGVETPEQVAALQLLGCAVGQGYYFARPLPAEAATAALASGLYESAAL